MPLVKRRLTWYVRGMTTEPQVRKKRRWANEPLTERVQVRLSPRQLRALDALRLAAPYRPDRGTYLRQMLVDHLGVLRLAQAADPQDARKAGGA